MKNKSLKMIKMKNENKPMVIKRCFALMLCFVCVLVGFSSFFGTISVNSETISSVIITFKQGSDVTTVNSSLTLFSDTTSSQLSTNASGCLVVPETYFNIYNESASTGEFAISLNSTYYSSTSANVLDCETFYFDDLDNSNKSGSWAYSFTGWKISSASNKIPEQTVFQPGDVITPDILEQYAEDSNNDGTYELTLEALWGKCYFIQNAYTTMVYSNSSGYYELDTSASTTLTGASDDNTGNDPANPKATIDGVYSTLRSGSTSTSPHRDYDAYATVVMLTGDLDYYKDSSRSLSGAYVYYRYYGYGADTSATVNNGVSASREYVSATYKSLQATRTYDSGSTKWVTSHSSSTKGTKYSYNYKGHGSYNYAYGNFRFDNILFKRIDSSLYGGSYTSEFQLYYPSGDTGLHYFETTARYNVYINDGGTTVYIPASSSTSECSAFSAFRTADHQYIVLNGGQINSLEMYWSSATEDITRYWYIGRLACVGNYITCGSTSTDQSIVNTRYGDWYLTVTGGKIGSITGSSASMYSTSVGDRYIKVYGDGSNHVVNGTLANYEYNPYITNLYGGGRTARLFGNVTVTAIACKNLINVYGGGKDYSATTYGNVTLNLTDCSITYSVYGGGQYANVEKIPSTYTQYTYSNSEVQSTTGVAISNLSNSLTAGNGGTVTVNISGTAVGTGGGSVYGSGMGQTQQLSFSTVLESHTLTNTEIINSSTTYYYPTDWTTEPTFPTYDSTTGYVLIGSYKYITWSSASPSAVNFRRYDYYAYLSLATVQNVVINITDGSTINGNVYGGGSIAKVLGDTEVNITDSTVTGTVYGGGDGATTPDAITVYQPSSSNSKSWTYSVTGYNTTTIIPTEVTLVKGYNALTDLTVLGSFTWSGESYLLDSAYNGIDTTTYKIYSENTTGLGSVNGNTSVTIKGNSTVGTVYGGGNQGAVTGNITVTVTGGEITTLYGGCNAADVGGNITVSVKNCTITTLYGGNNASGTVTGTIGVTVSQDSGSTTSITTLYGGGNEAAYSGTVTVTVTGGTIGALYGGGYSAMVGNTSVSITGGSVTGDVYGGGYSGDVGTNTVTGSTSVTVGGSVGGSIYGGGYQGAVYGNTTVSSSSTVGGTVYGGGYNGAVTGSTKVTVSGTVTGDVYGGGYNGAVTGSTEVELTGGGAANVYGGGYGSTATVGGNSSVTISGGSVSGSVYGGGNAGAVSGNSGVSISQDSGTTTIGGSVYGGGYSAAVGTASTANDIKTASVTITGGTITGSSTGSIFGGGYDGAANGATSVSVTGGSLTNGGIYGGGYNGAVTYSTAVTVGITISGNIYGGGYNGAVGSGATVSVSSGGGAANVYGGGYGSTATVGGNSSVTITDSSVSSDVYGGGEQGAVTGSSTVAISYSSGTMSVGGSVYGGGYSAGVGSASVSISSGASVTGNVYGGGYSGNVGSNNTAGSASVTVGGSVGSGTTGSIYGGGYNGAVYGNTTVEVSGTVADSIYGGGENGNVTGATGVTVSGGTVTGSVYGGGYAGDIYGTTAVSITDNSGSSTTIINGGVYGAGYGAEACVSGGTAVTINLTYSFTATEASSDTNTVTPSGQSSTTLSNLSGDSVIKGSVYGGGNLGTVGAGTINTSTNTANVTSAATTSVTVVSGHIEGSVYGGGYGVPTDGSYDIYMGTVFGSTAVTLAGEDGNDYIYIQGNVFGGGSQSRVYALSGAAATVAISSANGCSIALGTSTGGGSVFGGGERGNSATTNASVPTTIGDVSVTITGNVDSAATTIYFVSGGVYGDGNLCLVNGTRNITITNFNTGSSSSLLKTFYSLQRADAVTLSNTKIVLLGAVDLVAEGDSTTYSINRIESLSLTNGSTIKLDRIVNYLEELSSDVYNERAFINGGYNGSNSYNTGVTVYALNDTDISNYISQATAGNTVLDTDKYANTVCVANGLSLELRTTSGGYGTVKGLFTLSLLNEVEGEGGGFVYADIATSMGDFVCITKFSASGDYMEVVDDVGGYTGSSVYSYYYWYIQGSTIKYTLEVTGYIGSDVADYEDSGTVPRHTASRHYVLNKIEVNDTLLKAVTESPTTYTLVTSSSSLSDQQIAIEIMIGSTSLGFLCYDSSNGWGIYQDASKIYYSGGTYTDNDLATLTVADSTDSIYFILHKSNDANTEVSGMTVTITLDIYADNGGIIGDRISNGTNELIVKSTANIVRLVPEQDIYKATGKNYAGITTSIDSISITANSSFTVQYQTKYIPGAYPSNGTMTWAISTQGYAYYMDESGNYLTINTTTNTCTSLSTGLTYNGGTGTTDTKTFYVYKNGSEYFYYTSYTSETVNSKVTFTKYSEIEAYTIPAGTKITMVDLTGSSAAYYYYICTMETTYIALDSFMVMGSTDTIGSLTTSPAYKGAYTGGNSSTQVTENLIFIFDFEDTNSATGEFKVQLQHLYNGMDMMDFVSSSTTEGVTSYSRNAPLPTVYTIAAATETGYTLGVDFVETSYYDLDTAILNVTITPSDTYVNTRLLEYECALKIELVDSSGNTLSFPVGMLFEYDGTTYEIAADGSYVIIPLGTLANASAANTFAISIINELYSLSEVYNSGNTAYFKVTMYSAPNGNYYNYIQWNNATTPYTTASYTIETNPTYALSVVASDGMQVLQAGETLSFTVTASCSLTTSTENVTVSLMKKNDNGEYEPVSDMTELFASGTDYSSITASASGTACTWTINSSAAAGTYRLMFTYGDHVEYLNVIVYS